LAPQAQRPNFRRLCRQAAKKQAAWGWQAPGWSPAVVEPAGPIRRVVQVRPLVSAPAVGLVARDRAEPALRQHCRRKAATAEPVP